MSKLKGKDRAKASKKQRMQNKNSFFVRRKFLVSKIRKWDDPILKEVCDTVSEDEDVSSIIKELKNILNATKNGIGLAAPQIGYKKSIFAIKMSKSSPVTIFINAEIINKSEETVLMNEGCLSYPNFYTEIERASGITLKYTNEEGKVEEKEFSKLEARVIQHEYDHTLGVCLVGNDYYSTN